MTDIEFRYLLWKMDLGAIDEVDDNGCIHDDYRISYLKNHIDEME